MGTFSDKVAIAICDRCNFKYEYKALRADGNTPTLRVCEDCRDPKDPWRLPPIQPDAIALQKPRPDTPIGVGPSPRIIKWDTPGYKWDLGLKWDEEIAP